LNLKQYATAIADYEQAIEIQPDYVEAYRSLARSLNALARPRDAISALQQGISLQPKPAAVLWLDLGRFADSVADYTLAEQAFEQAIRIEPNNASQLNSIAWSLVTRRDVAARDCTRSIELVRRALEIGPEHRNGSAWNTLGVALYFAGNYQEALAALEKSVSLNPGETPSHEDAIFLAMAHWQLGARERAREYLKIFDNLTPPDPSKSKLLRFRDEARALIEAGETDPKI
jgi:tetratricopeptide (TPR) repeat protein